MKACNRCHSVKPEAAFYKRSRNRDGLDTICAECRCAELKVWRELHPDKVRAYNQRYYYAHHEQRKAYARRYYAENTEKCRALSKRWSDANRDILREYSRRYRLRKAIERMRGASA